MNMETTKSLTTCMLKGSSSTVGAHAMSLGEGSKQATRSCIVAIGPQQPHIGFAPEILGRLGRFRSDGCPPALSNVFACRPCQSTTGLVLQTLTASQQSALALPAQSGWLLHAGKI